MFEIGKMYSRASIAELINYPEDKRDGGAIFTGSFKHEETFYIFANIGTPGRTGHDYANHWIGGELLTTGRSGSRADQPSVRERTSGESTVHIFWRAKARSDFTYAGRGKAVEVSDTIPVEILWNFEAEQSGTLERNLDHQKPNDGRIPAFRPGPRQVHGRREYEIFDKGGFAYVAVLYAQTDRNTAFVHVKVGCTNDLRRRLSEHNRGFPPGFGWKWKVVASAKLTTHSEAYDLESKLLEAIRISGAWTRGEFARMSLSEAKSLLIDIQAA